MFVVASALETLQVPRRTRRHKAPPTPERDSAETENEAHVKWLRLRAVQDSEPLSLDDGRGLTFRAHEP